ncbi:MAG: dTDP-4-dehydrorhamnose 3,5-epimerase [Proteobacteria bacterium]|nr:dTDP-4-dehydrorhamnose 3,5-epimerase [Pseudomonadota bacterium]
MMSAILYTPLRRIPTPQGEVRRGLKMSDPGFAGFGEAYFSEVIGGSIKGWKRHRRMTMNLVVVVGTVRFILHDGDETRREYVVSVEEDARYGRLTVPPGLWLAFQGIGSGCNLVMNVANSEHDPDEAECCALAQFSRHLPAVRHV